MRKRHSTGLFNFHGQSKLHTASIDKPVPDPNLLNYRQKPQCTAVWRRSRWAVAGPRNATFFQENQSYIRPGRGVGRRLTSRKIPPCCPIATESAPRHIDDWGQCPDSEVRLIVPHAPFANFGIVGHWQLIDLVWLWFRSPHLGLAGRMMRTSEPPH